MTVPTDVKSELEAAFDAPDNDHGANDEIEDVPIPLQSVTNSVTYDFERTYDYPPPGSPPSVGHRDHSPSSRPPSHSFFRRAVGALLPSHYLLLPSSEGQVSRHIDGVFSNISAKPARLGDGNVHVVPEDCQIDAPPSYAVAQADAVPSYWDTTVHVPSDLFGTIVDDLPVGSFWVFAANIIISFFFQFFGFFFTYLLHTTHAAKYGSRAGLGLTLAHLGRLALENTEDNLNIVDPSDSTTPPSIPLTESFRSIFSLSSPSDWLAVIFTFLGGFLFFTSIIGYFRVKCWERSLRTVSVSPTSQDIPRDVETHRTTEPVSGVPFREEEASRMRPEDARVLHHFRSLGLL